MALTVQTLSLTPAERRGAERVNIGLGLMPRLKTDGPPLALGQRLNGPVSQAAGALTAAGLRKRGVLVSRLAVPGPKGEIPIRVLEPIGSARGVIVDFHGGGWVVGSAALNDRVNAHLAEAGFAVLSVEYRLLDQGRGVQMQDAVFDCVAALRWAATDGARRFGHDRIVTVGESAGAHLAALAILALQPAERVPPIAGCVFVQGVFDLSGSPSVRGAGSDCLLFDGANLARDLGRLVPERDEVGRRRPDVSPLYADLADLPPALFVTGDRDPLRDDSRLMAEAWARTADVVLLDVPTAPHGFQHFGAPTARLAQGETRRWIDLHLG